MNKLDMGVIFKSVQTTVTKHAPEILTAIGISGMATAIVLGVEATPKALKLIEEKKQETKAEKLPPIDVVKATWKCYIPTVITAGLSTVCLIRSCSVGIRRNAALATAYKISETALSEYREKVVETIGEKKEKTVREKVDKEHITKNPVSKSEVIVTESGTTLCYDHLSGRYFNSNIERIKKAVNELNRRMLSENYISLNEFYDELGLDHIGLGEVLGWNIDKNLIDIDFSSQIADDGRPCIVVDYRTPPRYGFSSYT